MIAASRGPRSAALASREITPGPAGGLAIRAHLRASPQPLDLLGEDRVGSAGEDPAGHVRTQPRKRHSAPLDEFEGNVGVVLGAAQEHGRAAQIRGRPRRAERPDERTAEACDETVANGMARRELKREAAAWGKADGANPPRGDAGGLRLGREPGDHIKGARKPRLVGLERGEETLRVPRASLRGGSQEGTW